MPSSTILISSSDYPYTLEEAVELMLAVGFIKEFSELEFLLIMARLAYSLSFIPPLIDESFVIAYPILFDSVITLLLVIFPE
jgi:hypothetical protein